MNRKIYKMKHNSLRSNQLEINVKTILINIKDSLECLLINLILNNKRNNKKKQLRIIKKTPNKLRNTVKLLLFYTNLLWKLITKKHTIKKDLTKIFYKI